jgi:1,4-alpha-glucan branching enzyme
MQGNLTIVLHAHLPFVRHPEHEKFLEESWLFEAITETYLPLLQIMEGWRRDRLDTRLTLTLSPTLCAMLLDPFLRERYDRHLNGLIELAEKEIHRTHWDRTFHELSWFYHHRFTTLRDLWRGCERNLVTAFRKFQDFGQLEIITTAATHALLPLFANHPPTIRAQILTARDHYASCFGCAPRGIWLPECAYVEGVEIFLQEANIRWFLMDTHGLLHAQPRPRYGVFAPVYTPNGIAAFGRDLESSRQVWSKHEGYPGDGRYRDFYRDIGFDLDFDYVKKFLPSPDHRGFTGVKYFSIAGSRGNKQPYQRTAALQAAAEHAGHFLNARVAQIGKLGNIFDRPPLVIAPYDAELFGHWWYEGPEFLDALVRKAVSDQKTFTLATPEDYLRANPTNQIAKPSPSSWGEEGYYRVWLNEKNEWIYPHLQVAQERMTELARNFAEASALVHRAVKQAGRELLLAQSSDWPFIMRTGTSPDYARQRVKDHLLRFLAIYDQVTNGRVDENWLREMEQRDNLFPDIKPSYWA